MAFFIRKSFRAGPVRLNLSKRGLGASIGVKGARGGLSSTGRTYLAGGRGGAYFRSNLTGPTRQRRRTTPSSSDVVTVETDTGATFAPEFRLPATSSSASLLGPKPKHHFALAIFGFPAASFLALLFAAGATASALSEKAASVVTVFALLIALIGWVALVVRQGLRAYRGSAFAKALRRALEATEAGPAVRCLRAQSRATAADVAYHAHAVYLDCLRETNLSPSSIHARTWLKSLLLLPLPPGSSPGGPTRNAAPRLLVLSP